MSKKKLKFEDDFLTRCYTQDGCIIFTGTPSAEYGRYRGEQAHRYAYRTHNGPIPKGVVIHHTCFCKRCVNPAHLEAVSQKKNVSENLRTGRMKHVMKLSPGQVIDIINSSSSAPKLARKHGVSVTTIRRIQKMSAK